MVYVNQSWCDLCNDNVTHVFCINISEEWRGRTANILVYKAREFRDQVIGVTLPPPNRIGRINMECLECMGGGLVRDTRDISTVCPRCGGTGVEGNSEEK